MATMPARQYTLLPAFAAVFLAMASSAQAQQQNRAQAHVQRAATATGVTVVRAMRQDKPALAVTLAAFDPGQNAPVSSSAKSARTPRIGFSRPTAELAEDNLPRRLQWQDLATGGRVAHFAVTSPAAAALRVGIVAQALPLDARIRFHDGSGNAIEGKGEEILGTVAANLAAGDTGANARTYWSPVIESSTAVVEIELPAGTRVADVRLGVPGVSHLVSSAKQGFARPKVEGSCAIDATCREAAWKAELNAEARILFTRNGVTYACSGTLLADQDAATEIPYFHTASHCISSQSEASSAVTYWFYRSRECSGATLGRFESRAGGATLLYTHAETDTSLLRLHDTPPAGAVYLGWSAETPAGIGAGVTGIHHSDAGQRISSGAVESYASCMLQGRMCTRAATPENNFYYVTWRAGTTANGASGSPLIADDNRTLIGHLSSGMSACGSGSSGDFYARFDVAYRAGLNRWLGNSQGPGAAPTASAEATRLPSRSSMAWPSRPTIVP